MQESILQILVRPMLFKHYETRVESIGIAQLLKG